MATSNNRQANRRYPFSASKSYSYVENNRYSHGAGNKPVCKYFIRGHCKWGDQCRNSHVIAGNITNNNNNDNKNAKYPTNLTRSNSAFHRSQNRETWAKHSPAERNFPTMCRQFKESGYCALLAYGKRCDYLHGDICNYCQKPLLHPYNSMKRDEHREKCKKIQEQKEEKRLAQERSKDKTCGICLDTVWGKDEEPRFGLLANCDHVFCLKCIRTWRGVSNYEHNVVKSCPECRTKSDFITPVKYWPKDAENKEEEIRRYKENLKKIHCKHFQRGDAVCPFGSHCFYLHMNKEGVIVELDPPKRQRRRILSDDDSSEIVDILRASWMIQRNLDQSIDDSIFNRLDSIFYSLDDYDQFTFDSDDDDDHVLSVDSPATDEEPSQNILAASSFWS